MRGRRRDHHVGRTATVEDGSHCGVNDACHKNAIDYKGRIDCAKAWR